MYGERQLGWDAQEQDANDTTHTKDVTGRLRAAMMNHRATFITESDFALLASKGINSVRIPVGFWLFQQTTGSNLLCCLQMAPSCCALMSRFEFGMLSMVTRFCWRVHHQTHQGGSGWLRHL